MSKQRMSVTGERVHEDEYKRTESGLAIYLMHQASYAFAARWVQGKTVLDYGCGSGYGSDLLAEVADSVSAVDVSLEAIQYAQNRYVKSNLKFDNIEPKQKLQFEDNRFDVVTSFQVIEHVFDHHHYLKEAYRVLRPGGTLMLITPDRKYRLLPFQSPWNRWHVREYSKSQLEAIVGQSFTILQSLSMGARGGISQLELRRYKFLKWMMLPLTLPIYPFRLRALMLNGAASMKSILKSKSKTGRECIIDSSAFRVDDVYFSEYVKESLNLVLICRK